MFLEVDASSVHAGWLPLVMTLLLLVFLVFLHRSMRKQMRRGSDLPTEAELRAEERAARLANGAQIVSDPAEADEPAR